MHVNIGYARRGRARWPQRFERVFAGVRGGRLAVGVVRRHGARAAAPATSPPRLRAVGVPRRRARRSRTSARTFPHRVTYHPTCHSLRAAAGRRPAAAAAARGARASTRRAAGARRSAAASAGRSRSRTPTPRWRCSRTRCAHVLDTGAEVCTRGRQLVPDAHRRRRCARQRDRRADDAPGRDPRRDDEERDPSGFPAAARAALGRRQLRAQPRQGDADDPRQAAPRGRGGRRLGGAARRRARRSRRARWRRCPSSSSASRRRSRAAGGTVHWARDGGGGERDRRRRRARRTAPTRSIKVKSLATDEIELNEALAADGIARDRDRSRRADRPARRRLAVAHPRPGDPPQPRRDPRRCSSARSPTGAGPRLTSRRRSPRPRACTCARSSSRRRWRSAGANFGGRRDGHGLRRRVRGQRAHVHDAARGARDGDGDREGAAGVARPRGVPAAAAALLDRRADEPVHVAVDRRRATATARRSSTSCCSTTAAPTCSPTRSGARRCTASAARACLNVCPVYSRTGGHAYESVYPGPDRRDPDAAARGLEREPDAAVGLLAVRRVLRGVPGEDRHPAVLVHLRARERGRGRSRLDPETLAMKALFHTFSSRQRYERAQKLARAARRPLARGGGGRPDAARAGAPEGARTRRARGRRAGPPISGRPGRWRAGRGRASCRRPHRRDFREWWRRTRGPARGASALAAPPARSRGAAASTSPSRNATRPARPRDARARILQPHPCGPPSASTPDVPRNYRTRTNGRARRSSTLFAERVAEYGRRAPRACRHRPLRGDGGAAAASPAHRDPAACQSGAERRGSRRATARGRRARAAAGSKSEDDGLGAQLDQLDGALTGCAVAIAETGTFVLDGGPGQGRRALTLVPDLHICVVRGDQVVGSSRRPYPARGSGAGGTSADLRLGPSATSDIELDRVEGVHGPRVLHVLVMGDREMLSIAMGSD